jgi:POT family proton-dependent oligopeptide transporter
MIISLFTFALNHKKLGPIGISPFKDEDKGKARKYEWAVYIGALACIPLIQIMVANTVYTDYFMYIIGPFSLLYLFYEMTKLERKDNLKLIAALVFIIFSVVFWAIFEQAGGSLSIYAAEHLKKDLVGLPIDPNMVNNSGNAMFVIFFAPVVGLLWLWMSKKKFEPNSVVKFGLGFLFLGIGFYTFFTGKFFADAAGMTSLNLFTFGYLIITFGEIALSPIGLSLMTKLSTQKLQGVMMGMWFLASAYGQYVAGLFGSSITPEDGASAVEKLNVYSEGYKQFGIYAIIAGVVLIAISPIVRKLMGDVK